MATTDTTVPAVRLNDIQFRLELLERFVNRIADDIEAMRAMQRAYDDEAKRQRDAWDGK